MEKIISDKHLYDENVTKAEETSFLENYTQPMIQLDSKDTILVICHTDNTVDKQKLRVSLQQTKMRLSVYELADFVKEADLYQFYLSL